VVVMGSVVTPITNPQRNKPVQGVGGESRGRSDYAGSVPVS
jgi:hypothetical protein